ncbi:MAG TPA: hypothetical protein VMV46_00175 [Thermoanaerobaculia bacterium]|nr:hypothetical protein [Thermoanaerobaculia bacterium]
MSIHPRLVPLASALGVAFLLVAAPIATRSELARAAVNARLALAGADHRLASVEFRRAWRSVGPKGKAPALDFVPADPRRGGRTDLTWAIDTVDVTGDAPLEAVLGAVEDALLPFLAERCADGLVVTPVTPAGSTDLGELEAQVLATPTSPSIADLTHGGWLPGVFFDFLAEGGSSSILALTATFVFIDAAGNPTDIDGNRALDVSHRETYYNDAFLWSTAGLDVDVHTVAIHETAHLFGLDDLAATLTTGSDPSSVEPIAAGAYDGIEHQLSPKARSSFCKNWRHWPSR